MKAYTVILIFVVMSLLGLLAAPRMSLSFERETVGHNITISYMLPNAPPEVLEMQVTAPLEGVMGTLQGVKHIKSTSDYNKGTIVLELDDNAELDKTRFEIASMIRLVYRSLPPGLSYPVISLDGPEDAEKSSPLLSLQVNANADQGQVRKYLEVSLKPALARIEGIGSVEIHGGEPEEWLLQYKPDVIKNLGITKEDIESAVSEGMSQTHLGWANGENGTRHIVSLAPASGPAAFEQILVSKMGSRVVKLTDIVTITKREKPAINYFRINGKNAVQVVLTPLQGINQLAVANDVKESLKTFQRELPAGYGIRIDHDSSEHIETSLAKMQWQALIALLLILLLTACVSRSWKVVCLMLASLTANLMLTALVFFGLDITVRLSSLSTLIVTIGLASGNILITHYHYVKRRDQKIIISLFGSTLIMTAALSVIWLLPDELRIDMTEFATVLMVVQGLSLCVCFWLVPAISEQLRIKHATGMVEAEKKLSKIDAIYYSGLRWIFRFKKLTIMICLLAFGLPIFLLPSRIESETSFSKLYNDIIGSDLYAENIRPYVDKGSGGFLRLFSNYVYDKSYYSSDEQTTLHIHAGLPNQSTVSQMDAVLNRVENELSQYKEIDRYIAQVHSGQSGSVTIYFKKPHDKGYFPFTLRAKAMAMTSEMSGIDWDIFGVGEGFSVSNSENSVALLDVALKGYNYQELERISIRLQEELLAHPRIESVNINSVPGMFAHKDLFAYKLNNPPAYWGIYGVSKNHLFQALEKFNVRPQPDFFELIGDDYSGVNIQPMTETAFDINALKSEPLNFSDSTAFKAGSQTDLIKEKINPNIRKENQQYLRNVSFQYLGDYLAGLKFLDKTLIKFRQQLPMGYAAEVKPLGLGQLDARRRYELITLSLVMIFITAAVMFESLRQPFTLIASITFSFIGLFMSFYFLNAGFDQGGYASFLLIIGISATPMIMMINAYNMHRKSGKHLAQESYMRALREQFLVILCFLACVLCALLPMLFYGAEQPFWYALAVGTLGGAIASVPLILLIVPILLISSKVFAEQNK